MIPATSYDELKLLLLQASVECEHIVEFADQAAFEAGFSQNASLSGTYSKNGATTDYTNSALFELMATPAADMTVALDCGDLSAASRECLLTEAVRVVASSKHLHFWDVNASNECLTTIN